MMLAVKVFAACRTSCGFLICFLLFACSPSPELLENNDPDSYALYENVRWASPGGFDLTMDIYTPNAAPDPSPVIVMFHGGGWLINDKSIMDQAAKYLATNSRYVLCNINYRLLSDNGNSVTLNQIVEDAFGAVLWVRENIQRYRGDGSSIVVTGDSAGGHLSAMIVNMGNRLNSNGFSGAEFGFHPTYLPEGMTPAEIVAGGGLDVQAAVLSYGAYDLYQGALAGFEKVTNPFWIMSGSMPRGIFGDEFNAVNNPEMYRAVSPLYNVPDSSKRALPPQLLTVGSEDTLVTPASVRDYMSTLQTAGHPVRYWEHEERPHAFLDSGSNPLLGSNFERDAPPALDVMISFLDGVFFDNQILAAD